MNDPAEVGKAVGSPLSVAVEYLLLAKVSGDKDWAVIPLGCIEYEVKPLRSLSVVVHQSFHSKLIDGWEAEPLQLVKVGGGSLVVAVGGLVRQRLVQVLSVDRVQDIVMHPKEYG